MSDNEKLKAVYKELMERAERTKAVDPNQSVTRYPGGFEIIGPGAGLRQYSKGEPIKVEGEPISEMLIRERR